MTTRFVFALLLLCSISSKSFSQSSRAMAWADSVLNSLTQEQRIAQLMVLRLSSYDFKNKKPIYFDSLVAAKVKQYNIGGICLFQGSAVKLGSIVNSLQSIAQTPLMVCIDGEWGVGMRLFDDVQALPRQMMLGAVQDKNIIYQYGKLVAEQCKRLGITVNYAPVVDVNNNPNNPVINDRSFGEDKYKVAAYGIEYMKGMQDNGVMACAKHFPGHGDVAVDSHFDLPVINKSREQLDSLELYPFREIFKAGVGSVMIAHLYIPSIDSTKNKATSVSKKNVDGLMRKELGYEGLTFTDGLEMLGVQKFYPGGEASAQSIIAGNDMLCLPVDVEGTIKKIKEAIADKQLSWDDINYHCKKVLLAKYQYGGEKIAPVDLKNIAADLNKGVLEMKKLVAEKALTLLQKKDEVICPIPATTKKIANDIAYISIGNSSENTFAKRLKKDYFADVFYFDYNNDSSKIAATVKKLKRYHTVIIGIHNYSRTPANNFGISKAAVKLVTQLQKLKNPITFVFGNPYAIKNWCGAKNIIASYEDNTITQNAAADFIYGKVYAEGKLPVTVCDEYKYGSGATGFFLPQTKTNSTALIQ